MISHLLALATASYYPQQTAQNYCGFTTTQPQPLVYQAPQTFGQITAEAPSDIRALQFTDALKKIERSTWPVKLYRGFRVGMQIFTTTTGVSGIGAAIAWLNNASGDAEWIKDVTTYATLIAGGTAAITEAARRVFFSQVNQINADLAQYLKNNQDKAFHEKIYLELCKAVGSDKLAEELFSTALTELLPSVRQPSTAPQQPTVIVVPTPAPTPVSTPFALSAAYPQYVQPPLNTHFVNVV